MDIQFLSKKIRFFQDKYTSTFPSSPPLSSPSISVIFSLPLIFLNIYTSYIYVYIYREGSRARKRERGFIYFRIFCTQWRRPIRKYSSKQRVWATILSKTFFLTAFKSEIRTSKKLSCFFIWSLLFYCESIST